VRSWLKLGFCGAEGALAAVDARGKMIEVRLYGTGALGENVDGLAKLFQENLEAADARFQFDAFRRFQRGRTNRAN